MELGGAWEKFFMLFHQGASISILRFIALPVNIAYSLVELENMEGNSSVRLKTITQNIEKKKSFVFFNYYIVRVNENLAKIWEEANYNNFMDYVSGVGRYRISLPKP